MKNTNMQPLDRLPFGVLKADLKRRQNMWFAANPGKSLDKYSIVRVAYDSFESVFSRKDLITKGNIVNFNQNPLYL